MRKSLRLTLVFLCICGGCARHKIPINSNPASVQPAKQQDEQAQAAAASAGQSAAAQQIAERAQEQAALAAAEAQRSGVAPSGQIRGAVTDTAGAAVPGAKVTATADVFSKTVTSDSAGNYALPGLPAGTYLLTFTASGILPRTVAGVTVTAGQTANVSTSFSVQNGEVHAVVMPDGQIRYVRNYAAKVARHKAARVRAVAAAPQDVATQVADWLRKLPKGSIQYRIYDSGGTMVLHQQYTATATIYPPGQMPPTAADSMGAGGQQAAVGRARPTPQVATNTVSIASWMRVDLVQTDNPGAFKIEPERGTCVMVLSDQPTAWTFTVTPLMSGPGKILRFAAYAAYGKDQKACSSDNPTIFPLPSGDPQTVDVKNFSVEVYKQQFEGSVSADPWKYIKQWLPGGAALTAVTGFIVWLRKWLGGKNNPPTASGD